ncbi:MAG: hypothetical protein J6386_18975 [Candidatus Synoicihabitans palmerolidicus]|nr:hypothetical protein [Candidatus Synoicihabitans palmerolidicus]
MHLLWDQVQASGVQAIRIGGNGYQQAFPDRTKLDEMVAAIHAIGTEPILQIPSTFTARQAAELVEHFSQGDERDVHLWSIGNEPFLHQEFTLEEVHAYILRIATAMKEVSPGITLFVYDAAWLQKPHFEALCGGLLDAPACASMTRGSSTASLSTATLTARRLPAPML